MNLKEEKYIVDAMYSCCINFYCSKKFSVNRSRLIGLVILVTFILDTNTIFTSVVIDNTWIVELDSSKQSVEIKYVLTCFKSD